METNRRHDKELTAHIGRKIKEFRKSKNLKQKDLAKRIKKSANTVSNYENGLIAPSQDALYALADILDVKIDSFFPGDDNSDDMHVALTLSEVAKSFDEMKFMNELLLYTKTLSDDEKDKLMNTLGTALDIFKNNVE